MARKQEKVEYTDEFLQFWGQYPKRLFPEAGTWLRVGKQEAAKAWSRLCAEDKAHAMYSVVHFFMLRPKMPPNAATWLNARGFDDWDMPEPEGRHLPEGMTNRLKNAEYRPVDSNQSRTNNLKKLSRL